MLSARDWYICAAMSRLHEVRDPLHGAIGVEPHELQILDHPLFQRLRHIKQLGFSDLAFPGATHSRYLHSVGAMHLAGRAFDEILDDRLTPDLSAERRAALRRMVRTAALLHDAGHAPFSHATEFAMPTVGEVDVPLYRGQEGLYPPERQATHEDYTIKMVTDSSLTPFIEAEGGPSAESVAGLVDPNLPVDPSAYEAGGLDWRPILQQLISSELDVDRMDYLRRDSHYAGVQYGVFDVGWLMSNLAAHIEEDRVYLALKARAIYTFDDFLIARYHMFLMVYYHYRSVSYEEMLKQYFMSGGDGYELPSDIEAYARADDHQLVQHLRKSDNEWARRIVDRREYKLLVDRHGSPSDIDLAPVVDRLAEAGIPCFCTTSKGVLSKYFAKRQELEGREGLSVGDEAARRAPPPIWVLHQHYRGSSERRATELEHSTDLFERYASQRRIGRVYVEADRRVDAGRVIADLS
ncbi:MAG: HD domain-containing protein [Myxococcota bacterium]|nr:HD domain-containing protein [Myxococcota bacterium]